MPVLEKSQFNLEELNFDRESKRISGALSRLPTSVHWEGDTSIRNVSRKSGELCEDFLKCYSHKQQGDKSRFS